MLWIFLAILLASIVIGLPIAFGLGVAALVMAVLSDIPLSIMIEQSIKIALAAFVFEPNKQNTWLDVKGSITSFLIAQWSIGALAGATPEDAFEVSVDNGATWESEPVKRIKLTCTFSNLVFSPFFSLICFSLSSALDTGKYASLTFLPSASTISSAAHDFLHKKNAPNAQMNNIIVMSMVMSLY